MAMGQTSWVPLVLAAAFAACSGCGQTSAPKKEANSDATPSGNGSGSNTGNNAGGGSPSGGSSGMQQAGMHSGGYIDDAQSCAIPATPQLRRLTNEQYERTVRDLLGVTTLTAFNGQSPSALLAPDHFGDLNAEDWNAYLSVAEAIAAQVMADPAQRSRFLACTPTEDGTACLHDTIVSFGRRAFRRPLSEQELARFDKLVSQRAQITATGAPAEIAEVLLQTFLTSPSFLQRAEIAEKPDGRGRIALSPHELATRLSYLLWGSTPDEALSQAADANELETKDQIFAHSERMLRDPRAHAPVAAFHRFYRSSRVLRVATEKDPLLFPGVDDAVLAAINEESERFFDAIVFEHQGTFQDLLTSPLAFVNAKTARFYGLEPAKFAAEFEQVTLDASQRPGFLTRLGFLAANAHPERSAPALRGAFVIQDILGMNLSPPPHAVATPLPLGPEFHSNRQRVAAQTAGTTCDPCHKALLDPPGFVLEAYNAVGAWQTVEADSGATIDTSAEVNLGDRTETVQNPQELMKALAGAHAAQRTYVKRWVSYVYDRRDDPDDSCVVDPLVSRLASGRYPIVKLITDLTLADSFRMRTQETP